MRPGQAQQITVSEDLAAALDDDGDVRPAAPAHTFTFDYVYDQVSAAVAPRLGFGLTYSWGFFNSSCSGHGVC